MILLVLALVFVGCAKPPVAEQAAAKTAMDAAVTAGATTYAAADFEAAKKLWDTAEGQVSQKMYKEAKQGYIDAKAAFEKAAAAVEAGKKAAADQVNATVASMEEGWKGIEGAVKKAGKKMKDMKDAWEADAKAFADGLKATKDMIAADPAGAVKKAGEIKALIDKWNTTFNITPAPAAAVNPAEAAKQPVPPAPVKK